MQSVKGNGDHTKCSWSTNIIGNLSVGQGQLDSNGFWEIGCPTCARAGEQRQREKQQDCEPIWPHTKEQLIEMGFTEEELNEEN